MIGGGFGNHFATGRGHKTLAPKLDAFPARGSFVPNAVHCRHETSIGDRVAALDGLPRVVLSFAFGGFFGWMPADGGGVKNDLGAGQCRKSRCFGIPLVPANQHANFAKSRFPRAEALIAGREVKFLIIQWVIGNVHFAVSAQQRAIGIDDGGGVVEKPRRALLEKRGDDHHHFLARQRLE